MTLAITARLPRPQAPEIPDGWREHHPGLWSWTSSGQTVTVSILVCEDGTVSAPSVSGLGRFRLVTSELERAITAQAAFIRFLRDRAAWAAFIGRVEAAGPQAVSAPGRAG